ncbi:MAG: hypothetical protein ACJA1Z_000578 [Patiriisocius sp.]|jgi:hypothetical protein
MPSIVVIDGIFYLISLLYNPRLQYKNSDDKKIKPTTIYTRITS